MPPTIEELFSQARRQWAFEGAEIVAGIVKERLLNGEMLKVDQGNLWNRIDTAQLPEGFQVGTSVDYGVYLHEGIREHTIVPRKPGGVLRWEPRGGGAPIYARRVTSPAQPPRPFLKRGFELADPELVRRGEELYTRAVNQVFPDRTITIGRV